MADIRKNDNPLSLVAHWRQNTAAQQRKYAGLSISAFLLAFVVCIFSFFWFQNRNYDRIVKQNMNYIQDSAIQEANQVEHTMSNARLLIINLASQYTILSEHNPELSTTELLQLLRDENLFDRIAYISADGMDTSLEGVADVSDRYYFKQGMKGNSGWQLIDKSRVTGKATLVFYAPITTDGIVSGVMAGFYEQDRLDDLFAYQLFNFEPNTYLLLGDGTVIANSKKEDISENYLDYLSTRKYTGDVNYEDIKQAISDPKRTTITFSFTDNHKTSVGVIVQFNESDWMLVSILPHTITTSMVSNANHIGVILLVIIVAVFLVLISILLLFLRNQGRRFHLEIRTASEKLEETAHDEEINLSIISSLVDVYASVYYIDLDKATFLRVKEGSDIAHRIPKTGPAVEGFRIYVETFIAEAYRPAVSAFLNVDTFAKRMKEHGSESIEYQRVTSEWKRGTIVTAGLKEDGSIASVVFAVQEINEEKQAELQTKKALEEAYAAAQVANQAKTTFLSNMSHDIRTPMNAIVGMTAIAAANLNNTEKVSDCLKKITSSSKHLLGLINEVLDMSKIESGKVDLSDEEFSLSDLIDSLISIHQPLIKEKNHTLLVKINNLQHEKVVGDSTRLQQVFTNLLSNAIKYTPAEGKIEITVSEKDTNNAAIGYYEVIFKDNGIGMSEEFQKNMFEPFSRAKDARIANTQGTGLGMPIAKNIIRMMNGDIAVESKIDEGTTFTVSFALKLQLEEDIRYEEFVDLPVLVVDDDITACESTCTILNDLAMNSEWVTSGREAIDKVTEHHDKDEDYYAVIVDWKMPDMNGIETTREIRKRIGNDIPIIVISAYDWTDIEAEAKEAGVNAFLSKPLFKSRIVSLFNGLLDKKPALEGLNVREQVERHDFTGKRILLVEDNELNREIATELLTMTGLTVDTAEDGSVAVQKFSASAPHSYDMILMDIQMPVMNGYEATRAIRELSRPDATTVPIIAMTANAFASDVRDAFSAGMNGHIAKPIDIAHVVKVLEQTLGGGVVTPEISLPTGGGEGYHVSTE